MKHLFAFLFILSMVIGLSSQAQSDLYNRGTDTLGYQLIYDSDLNITWYDFSLPYSQLNSWQSTMNWASALSVNFGGTKYDDWRLPTALNYNGTGPCSGYNCAGSEMGHLFYTELGNKAYDWTTGTGGWSHWGDFQHLSIGEYWSSTEYTETPGYAWYFLPRVGTQDIGPKNFGYMGGYTAIAVRDGDVVAAPEPISSILFITGGATLIGRKYIRKKTEV